jgi:hypothetical protein
MGKSGMLVNEKRLEAKVQAAALRLLASLIDEIGTPYDHISFTAETVNAHIQYVLTKWVKR